MLQEYLALSQNTLLHSRAVLILEGSWSVIKGQMDIETGVL